MSPLVTPEALARHPQWRVFDCRHDLLKPALGEEQYAKAHIAGAQFAHLDRDLSAPKDGTNGRHPLPAPRAFADWLGRQGLRRDDFVVAYDAGGGTMAARLWWMLRWVGHDGVAVLDGGYARWAEEARPVTAEIPQFAPTRFQPAVRAVDSVDARFLEGHLGAAGVLLLDARAAPRFRGEAEPIDVEAGRIPGSRNRFCGENLAADGVFKSAAQLRLEFGALLGDRAPGEIVHYCGSGVAACHNALAMEIAGFPGSRLYAGSWSEWIADPRRPREKG